jgi:hypothetical protein
MADRYRDAELPRHPVFEINRDFRHGPELHHVDLAARDVLWVAKRRQLDQVPLIIAEAGEASRAGNETLEALPAGTSEPAK